MLVIGNVNISISGILVNTLACLFTCTLNDVTGCAIVHSYYDFSIAGINVSNVASMFIYFLYSEFFYKLSVKFYAVIFMSTLRVKFYEFNCIIKIFALLFSEMPR